jgi:hypothetical protein
LMLSTNLVGTPPLDAITETGCWRTRVNHRVARRRASKLFGRPSASDPGRATIREPYRWVSSFQRGVASAPVTNSSHCAGL